MEYGIYYRKKLTSAKQYVIAQLVEFEPTCKNKAKDILDNANSLYCNQYNKMALGLDIMSLNNEDVRFIKNNTKALFDLQKKMLKNKNIKNKIENAIANDLYSKESFSIFKNKQYNFQLFLL